LSHFYSIIIVRSDTKIYSYGEGRHIYMKTID
jgi:hypothetical protein